MHNSVCSKNCWAWKICVHSTFWNTLMSLGNIHVPWYSVWKMLYKKPISTTLQPHPTVPIPSSVTNLHACMSLLMQFFQSSLPWNPEKLLDNLWDSDEMQALLCSHYTTLSFPQIVYSPEALRSTRIFFIHQISAVEVTHTWGWFPRWKLPPCILVVLIMSHKIDV
jgi:hypothetical protein